jgi:hypothetical protein
MVGTIIPIVNGERQRKTQPVAQWIYTLGCLLGAALLGSFVGGIGALLFRQLGYTAGGILILASSGAVSILYSCREAGLIRVPSPQSTWQVPSLWRSKYHPNLAALIYGIALGAGVVTRISVSTFYVIIVWILLTGSPIWGALIMGFFGFGRALSLLYLTLLAKSNNESWAIIEASHAWKPVVHLVNGLTLICVGAGLLTACFMRL